MDANDDVEVLIDRHVTMYERPELPNIIKFIFWCDRQHGASDSIAFLCTLRALKICFDIENKSLPMGVLRLTRIFYQDCHSIPFWILERATNFMEQ